MKPFSQIVLVLITLALISSCGGSSNSSSKGSHTQTGAGGTGTQTQLGEGHGTAGDGGSIDHDPESGNDGGFISNFKPALVVRATGCIMCHGKVEANVITDFGYGNSYFFGQDGVTGLTEFSGSIYGDHANSWNTTKIWGKVYVPQAPVTFAGTTIPTTLAQYLVNMVQPPDTVTPKPEIVEQSSVYIGTPTASRILQAAGTFPSGQNWKYISNSSIGFDGLVLSSNGQYYQNRSDQPFVCKGDLIVDGIVMLDHLQLQTNNLGCRIYATKSVFVQGPITYLGTSPYRNLQIASSRAVALGLGFGNVDSSGQIIANNSLVHRLQSMWTRPGFFSREPGDTGTKLDTIVNESFLIPNLTDANSQPEGRNVAFERLFINTPHYQSRYLGEFKGVIVSETALGSLGDFAFKFDDVFTHTNILPLFQESEIFQIIP